ncbi:response regulator transcription factor [uncultured Treponema sp.]|uniref:response regulator transcription factor n=1 Tax=uncultured Treponema sp. TaxID=162155 RepID=UPI0025E6B02C|nr:response regulator transcription factor [uncultured Treponema sp.]
MSTKILVIEDVPEMSDLISMYLSKEGMDVSQALSAEDAIDLLKTFTPELVILDLNLPGMSGFEFLKFFREKFNNTIPVIIASARDGDEDIIEGLGLGADEFVTKPFSPRVLVAKVKANLRRGSEISAAAEQFYAFGDYKMLLNSCVLKKGSEKISLSNKEYKVLEFLTKHPGEKLSPEKIYREVWGTDFGDVTAVAVYIQRLRKKIESNPAEPRFIKTVFGMGYIFEN